MKRIILVNIFVFTISVYLRGFNLCPENHPDYINPGADSLPSVMVKNHSDLIAGKLRYDAMMRFSEHQLPENLAEWESYRLQLKDAIVKKTGVVIDHNLPVNLRETGTIRMDGYTIKNIVFQTRPGIYATSNLYIPDGNGPFPAVIHMLGHWQKGKIDSVGPQAVGHSLALNGYVCLTIDPWGSGERTTIHGTFEDHGDGNNLGSSILNLGETLMGIELSDNIRGVDLLCSLPYVDTEKIGATGASGGGNQTMWLASVDERIKAAMPVVSVGTFESYIMGTPCICEVIEGALTFTEESGILALIAPRAIKMCNHDKDANPAFYPSEMLRSYHNAKHVFRMYGAEDNLSYQLFDLRHGYMQEDREAMLGWFDLHLKGKGNGSPKKEIPFKQLPLEKLMVFPVGKRDADVITTVEYCKIKGSQLRENMMNTSSFDLGSKRDELRDILGVEEESVVKKIHEFSKINEWERVALETYDMKLIPLLIRPSSVKPGEYIIVSNPEGKENISYDFLEDLINSGVGIVVVDLSGTGEASSVTARFDYNRGKLRVISRSELWFGRTLMGEWVKELNTVVKFLKSNYQARNIQIDGSKETGLAGLFLSVLEGNIDMIILRNSPVSYLFDNRESVDFFSSVLFLPGFMKWGDISLAAGLSGKNVVFIGPLSISGQRITGDRLMECNAEFQKIRNICRQPGITVFK